MRILLSAFLALSAVVCAGSHGATRVDAAEPQSLFDGKSLDHWEVLKCDVEVVDGVVLLKAGNGLLQSKQQYKDFTFECEWKTLETKMWDSGIYFRYESVPEGRPWPDKYQVNLRKEMECDLVGFDNGKNSVPVKPQQWNQIALTVKGKTASLKVNGKQAWEVEGIETPEGYIAIQAEVPGGGKFLFRGMRITQE